MSNKYKTYRVHFKEGEQKFWRSFIALSKEHARKIAVQKYLRSNPNWSIIDIKESNE